MLSTSVQWSDLCIVWCAPKLQEGNSWEEAGGTPARRERREFLHLWESVVVLTGGWMGGFTSPVSSVFCVLVYHPCPQVSKGTGFTSQCNQEGWGSPGSMMWHWPHCCKIPALFLSSWLLARLVQGAFAVPNSCRAPGSQAMLQNWPKLL